MAANDPGQPPGPRALTSTDLPTPSSALAIAAHPDDVEFGCGATLAKWAASGCVIHHLVLTDGSKGTWDADADTRALVERRMVEQRAAAQRLGGDRAGEVIFLHRTDGELSSDLATRGEVARVIRQLRPEVVLGHDPWKRYRLHPDHRHAGLLACEGIVAARDPHFFREHHLAPHRPSHLLLWEADEANHAEEVSGFIEHKLAALRAHESQFESTMGGVDDAALRRFEERITSRLVDLGQRWGCAAAEVFVRLSDL